MNRLFWLSPILLGIFFVLVMYSNNILLYRVGAIWVSLISTIIICCIIYLILHFTKRDKAALIASLFIVGIFGFGYNVIIAFISIIAGVILLAVKKPLPRFVNVVVLCISACLAVVPLSSIIIFNIGRPNIDKVEITKQVEKHPGIYYLILDSYSSNKIMKGIGIDNTEFIDYLEQKGFMVKDSFCNYPRTYVSTASFLNMDYIENPDSLQFCYNKVQNNDLFKYFKSIGYKVVNVGSDWYATEIIGQADENYYYKSPLYDSFTATFSYSTIFAPISQFLPQLNLAEIERRVISYQLNTIENYDDTQPIFLFSHILLPHHAYPLFYGDGSLLPDIGLNPDDIYKEHIMFVNNWLMGFLDKHLNNDTIIVLQSDEGLCSYEFIKLIEQGIDISHNLELMKQKAGILNAYFVPDVKIYDGISPVNSWRLIINQVFDENFEILPDIFYYTKNYINQGEGTPSSDFYDATEIIK